MLRFTGGMLGFFCSHRYAHSDTSAQLALPRKLKGSDMALFAVLRSLGLKTEVRPVLEHFGEFFCRDEASLDSTLNEIDPDPEYDSIYLDYIECGPVDYHEDGSVSMSKASATSTCLTISRAGRIYTSAGSWS
jgi:hypothetical protein